MSASLKGNLVDFSIADVFQLIGQQRKTGSLEICNDGDTIRMLFDGGMVVRAEPTAREPDSALADMLVRCGLVTRGRLREFDRERKASLRRLGPLLVDHQVLDAEQLAQVEDLLTHETLFRLLRWSDGSFHFEAKAVDHDRPAERLLAAEGILMDGLRMVDEWRTFADQVPSEETVFQRVGRFEDYQARAGNDAQQIANAQRVFLLIDGRLPVRRVIDLARLGTFEGTRLLASLRRAGLVEPMDPSQIARRRPPKPMLLESRPPSSRAWIAGALPLLLLLLLAVANHRPPAPTPEEAVFPIRRAPLEEARASFATDRVRKALEVHRFATGRWPDELEELVSTRLLTPDALTTSARRPYYYVRQGENVLLLAPER